MNVDSELVRQYLANMTKRKGVPHKPGRPSIPLTPRDAKRLQKLVSLCADLPEAEIALAGERHLALNVRGKTFAYYLHDHHGDGKVCICCKSTVARQQELITREPLRYFVPAYLGTKGWVSLRLDGASVDWVAVLELVFEAYRSQAPRRLAAQWEQ